jgi:hypothetical protein
LEGRDHVLVEALYRQLPGCAKEKPRKTPVKVAGIPAETPTKDLPNTSLGCYRSANLLSMTRGETGESGRMFPVSSSSPASSRRSCHLPVTNITTTVRSVSPSDVSGVDRAAPDAAVAGSAHLLCSQKGSGSDLSSEIEFPL